MRDDGTGYVDWLLAGIEKAIESGANVINMSLGMVSQLCSGIFLNVFLDALLNRAYPVAAAGNLGPKGGTVGYPASVPFVISVGSISITSEAPAWFSSRGPACGVTKPDCVSFGGAGDEAGIYQPIETVRVAWLDGYADVRGTSFSCPIVSGILALTLEVTSIPVANIDDFIKYSSRDVWRPGKDNDTGWGVLEADKAVKATVPAFSIPEFLLMFSSVFLPGIAVGLTKVLRK